MQDKLFCFDARQIILFYFSSHDLALIESDKD